MPQVEVTPARNSRLGWNAASRQALADYLAEAMVALRLADYGLTVELSALTEEGHCYIDVVEGQRRGVLFLPADFLTRPPRWQQEALLHELLHLHLNPTVLLAASALKDVLDDKAAQATTNALWAQVEYPTDALASVLADLTEPPQLPAPKQPAARTVRPIVSRRSIPQGVAPALAARLTGKTSPGSA